MQRLSAAIAGTLEKEILAGTLPSGERLPSEEKLCARFEASRTVIREAIQQLRGRGLLRTLKGSGTYIADPSLDALGSAIETYSALVGKPDFLELIDFRILVESECARLATHRGSARQITAIRKAIDRMIAAKGDLDAFSQADIAFHLAIAKASANRLYDTMLTALEKRCIEFAQSNRGDHDWFDEVIDFHREVLAAIESGNAQDAAAAMRRHLLHSRRQFIDVAEHHHPL
jgi:DNA-binding FadR family transcriptional regulator